MITLRRISFACFSYLLFPCFNQTNAQEVEVEISKEEIAVTIDSINSKLNQLYVFPEIANEMTQILNINFQSGRYDALTDPFALASQLTTDLQSISKDKHLRVYFDPEEIAFEQKEISESERAIRQKVRIERMELERFGFEQVKMLEGRIGYLDLRAFMETQFAEKAAHKAMSRITNSDAIIIDLRNNIGGSPSMIQLLSSYFFGPEPVHLNSFYFRPADEHTETWTFSKIPGKRRPEIDLYILTSSRTFSAGEEFAYNLKNLKRATIIGETTAGGAHPGGPVTATDKFRVWVPSGRAINPITKTNWEGTGVQPDLKVQADEALMVAHVKALESLRAKATNDALESYNLTIHELKRSYKLEQSKYADVLVDAKFEKWNDRYETFYGGSRLYILDTTLTSIDPRVVLGNSYYYVTLPKGSYVTVQFTDNLIVDTPRQDDIFIDEIGSTGDQAAIHVSSDGINYQFLGIANGGKTNSMDLADINFKGVVSYIKVIGLDLNGASPGFDVVRIYGLPNSNIDKYVAEDELESYLEDPNIYHRKILLEPIEFNFDSHELLPKGMAYLNDIIDLISSYPQLKLRIIGHTDNIGSDEFNEELSVKRAKSVYNYFIEKGLNSTYLTYEGRGNKEPLAHNDTKAGRKRNRRVELIKIDE